MSCTKILGDNWLQEDVVSNTFISSEQAAFPAVNLYSAQRRSKVWRSNGYWEVTSSNNQIVFEETASTPLTATIAVGEYNSSTAFFAAIKTALEDVGASTYTVVADTNTFKVKITSNGSGGGGIFNLLTTNVGFTADLLGYDDSANKTGSLTYTADVLKLHSSEWIKFDFGLSSNPKAFVLIGPRNEPIKITPSAVIKLQGNETDTWDNPSYDSTLTYYDENIFVLNEDGLHTEPLRYWRVYIEDMSNANGYVEVGSLYLGDAYGPPRGAVQFPFQSDYVDRSTTVFSEGGQSFSDIKQKSQSFSIKWDFLQKADIDEFDYIFSIVGTSIPFFMIFDENAAFSTVANHYVRFVKFQQAPGYELRRPDVFTSTMNFVEQL